MSATMTTAQLTRKQRRQIGARILDREEDRHESLEWKWLLPPMAAFLLVDGSPVLLPVWEDHLRYITVLRVLRDGDAMVVFLKDTTYFSDPDKEEGGIDGGYMAFCQRWPGADFYVTTIYHTIYMVTPRPYAPL